MVFFGDEKNKSLSEALASGLKSPLFYPQIDVFPDGERRIRIQENVVEQHVCFVKTASVTSNIDSFVLETAFLIDTIKRSGASQITGIIPYIPYSRADHIFRDGEGVPLEVIISIFEKARLSKIILTDPHTIKMEEMFSITAKTTTALPLFAEKIKELGFDPSNSSIVSPDMGGLRRMGILSEHLGDVPFASVEKNRNYENGSISDSKVHGEIKKTCFIVDDIASSGKTMAAAIDIVEKNGAERIFAFATHAVFSEDAVSLLQNSKAEKVFVTDSIPLSNEKRFEKLEIISLAPVLLPSVFE
jgi:ribose-phosphate pyrophosphokinase